MADLTCGMKVIKYLLFAFNIVFFVMGFSMTLAGGVVLGQLGGNPMTQFFGGTLNYAGALTIVVGVFVMILAFFGCCGAFMENKCMVTTYYTLMIVLVLIQIVVVIVATAMRDKITELIEEKVDGTMPDFDPKAKEGEGDVFTLAWNQMQQELECCGLYRPDEWEDNVELNLTKSVPDSCCIHYEVGCGEGALITGSSPIYRAGCKDKLESFLVSNIMVGVGFGVFIFLLQIVGIIFACCLARQIGNYKEV